MRNVLGLTVLALFSTACFGRTSVGELEPTADSGPAADSGPRADAGASDAGEVPDSSIVVCSEHGPETCEATGDCTASWCPGCDGIVYFNVCFSSQEVAPPCPDIQCPVDCRALDEPECNAAPECRVFGCPDCHGDVGFMFCGFPDDPPPPCPPPLECEPCADFGEDACTQSPECHPVYDGSREPLCDCKEPGCCTVFSFCAEGGLADCRGPATCRQQEPFCDGPYTVAFVNQCYEGCVRSEHCAP